jgi:hypothetical protein
MFNDWSATMAPVLVLMLFNDIGSPFSASPLHRVVIDGGGGIAERHASDGPAG